jgi:hypothetical protein
MEKDTKNKVFEDIKQGLEQAIAYEKGDLGGIELDPTGAELMPGDPECCQGNGEDPRFEICCDECDHYLACFPEYQGEVDEALEDLRDLKAAERALEEHQKNPVTYSHEEAMKMLDEEDPNA